MKKSLLLITMLCIALWSYAQTTYHVGGTGANNSNPGTQAQPFATPAYAATHVPANSSIHIHAGTYRETIVPNVDGLHFFTTEAERSSVIISGLNQVTTTWMLHNSTLQLYRTPITLPVHQFNEYNSGSNITILANQVFKDGEMMFLANSANFANLEEMFDKNKFRRRTQGTVTTGAITDSFIGTLGLGAGTGMYVWQNGWYVSQTRPINTYSGGNTINFQFPVTTVYNSQAAGGNNAFQRYWVLYNNWALLNVAKEWYYDGTNLYVKQQGGGVPTGIEYKARNFGFDLRGRKNIKITNLSFIGCDPAVGSETSDNMIVDNIRAKYLNHAFISTAQGDNGDKRNATQTGLKAIGPNSVVKNSEFFGAGDQAVWIGNGGKVINNKFHAISYNGMMGAPISIWGTSTSGVEIGNNTSDLSGRGIIELASGTTVSHTNMNIHNNDFYGHNALSIDGGAIYSQVQSDHTGTRIHHNYFHDNKAVRINGEENDGIQITGAYFDQASGPVTIDHNVHSGGVPFHSSEYYSELQNQHRNNGGNKLYNNTFASDPILMSTTQYVNDPVDTHINNIYRKSVNKNNGNAPVIVQNGIQENVNPQFVTGQTGMLRFQLQSTSPAINAGQVIPGITDGSNGTPDIGALEYGQAPWTCGYVPVTTVVNPPGTAIMVDARTPSSSTGICATGCPLFISGAFLAGIDKTDWMKYTLDTNGNQINLTGKTKITLTYARGNTGNGRVQLRTMDGTLYSDVTVFPTGGWGDANQSTLEIPISNQTSLGIYFTFYSSPDVGNFNLKSIKIE